MINVKRSDCPDILKIGITPESDGEWETKDAIVYFQDVANHPEKYKRTGKEEKKELSKDIRYTLIKVLESCL